MAKANIRHVLTLCALGALVACGGGGGSSSSTVTIGGTAAKGLIANGKVLVYATDSTGKQITTPIAQGATDDKGQYSLSIPPQSTPIIISVVKGTNSKVMDELTGVSEDMPDGFELKAVTSSATQNATVGVNPFTDVAAAAVPSNGFTKDMVDTANHWVKTNLTSGVDPVAVQPVLTTTTAASAEAQQKTLTAALALVAAAAKNNSNCNTVSTVVAEQFKCQITEMRNTVAFTDNGGTPTLSKVNGNITTLMTNPTVIAAVNNSTVLNTIVNITSDVSSVTSNTNLVKIKTTIGNSTADATDSAATSKLTDLAPPSVATIKASQEATTYATNLKTAIKSANSDFVAQKNFFESVYMNKTVPALNTVDGGLNLITQYCNADKTTMTVTCSAPNNTITLSGNNAGSVTLSGTPGNYAWSGTAGGKSIAGSMTFVGTCSQPSVCSLRIAVKGQFPNDIKGEPHLDVTMDVSMAVDDLVANTATDKRTFQLTVNSAQVSFPATASFPAAVMTLSNGSVSGKIYQYGAYRAWNCWNDDALDCFVAKTGETDTTSMPTRIQGVLALTSTYTSGGATYSDVISADVLADFVAPTQAVWTSMNARSRFYMERNKLIDYMKVAGSMKVGKYNATYSVTAIADPDWTGVDLTKSLSSTNYPKGSATVSLDGGNIGGTSLAKMALTVSRVDYNNVQPKLELTAGGDTFTFQPNTTDGSLPIDNPGLAAVGTTASTSAVTLPSYVWVSNPALYPSTDWFKVSPQSSGIMSTAGVKAFNANNAYTIQVAKANNKITGTVKKGTTQVGEITDGRLYLDGQIFPLTLD